MKSLKVPTPPCHFQMSNSTEVIKAIQKNNKIEGEQVRNMIQFVFYENFDSLARL